MKGFQGLVALHPIFREPFRLVAVRILHVNNVERFILPYCVHKKIAYALVPFAALIFSTNVLI
jgi:hypothetical protein